MAQQDISVGRLAETVVVHFFAALVFIDQLVRLVSAARQDPLRTLYWWTASASAACILSGTAFCVWFLACHVGCSIPFQLWQISVALAFPLTQVLITTLLPFTRSDYVQAMNLWRVAGPILRPRLIAGFVCGLQFLLLAPGGLYLYLTGRSEVLWALALPSYVGECLLTCHPVFTQNWKGARQLFAVFHDDRYRTNWKGAGRQLAVILASVTLLIWSSLSRPSDGQYAAHNTVSFIVVVMRWKPMKVLFRRKSSTSSTNQSDEVQTHQPTANMELGGEPWRQDDGSKASLVQSSPHTV